MIKNIIIGVLLFIIIAYFGIGLLTQTSHQGLKMTLNQEKLNEFSQKQCLADGSVLYEEHKKELGNERVFNPIFHYNSILKTCLYSGGNIGDDGYIAKWVIDVYSNREILTYISINNQLRDGVPVDEFDSQEEILMSQ